MREAIKTQFRQAGFNHLVVVSNRAPYVLEENAGEARGKKAVSGLVSALEPILENCGGTWVGWCGRKTQNGEVTGSRFEVPFNKPAYTIQELMLGEEEFAGYYHGFSNDCLWPVSHCFLEKSTFDHEHWRQYYEVNKKFASVAARASLPGSLIWVQDYHLTLVPRMLRDLQHQGKIAFFWHIPFPPLEIFSAIPWADQILKGLLNSDLLAFHLEGYVYNFLRCAQQLLGAPVDYRTGTVLWRGRAVSVQALPIGIDATEFEELAARPEVIGQASVIRQTIGADYLFVSVERLDYTKGVLEKLLAIEKFLELHPGYRDRVAFLQVAVPTRTEVATYAGLRKEVEETVGRINGLFGADWRVPVRYRFDSLSRPQLVAHYLAADVALVTPLRDGLNLVAKEFVASRVDRLGSLILSPFAGVAEQLSAALRANPYDALDMVEQMRNAIEMSPAEQAGRMAQLQKAVKTFNLGWWWQSVLNSLNARWTRQQEGKVLTTEAIARLAAKKLPKRVI